MRISTIIMVSQHAKKGCIWVVSIATCATLPIATPVSSTVLDTIRVTSIACNKAWCSGVLY